MGNHGKSEQKGEMHGWRGEFLRQVKYFIVEKVWPALICSQLPFSLRQQRVLWADEPCCLALSGHLALSGLAWLALFGSVRPCLVGSVWLCQALPGFVWPFRALSGTAILCSLPELFPDHTQLPVAVFCLFWHKGHVPFMFLTIFQLPPWILLPSCRPQSTLFLQADFQRELLWPFSNCVIMCTGESW